MLARIKVLVAKVPTICAALDCQGGDSGQITAGGWGEGEGEIFKRVLLAFREQKTCLQVFKFSCLQAFCSEKGGRSNKGNEALPGEREGIRAGCYDPTALMPFRSFGEAVCHRCSFARRMRRCQCR